MTRHAHSVIAAEIAQSRREHRIRRGGEEEKAEDLLS